MKEFFKTPKKAIISIVCIVLLIAIIAVIAMFATTSFAESSSIGKQNAQNFAFVDAGVDPVEVEKLKTEFEFKNGQFVYEVEFVSNGTEYEYWIKASNGSIVKKEMDASDGITNQKEEIAQGQEKNEETTNTNSDNQEKQPNENTSKDKTDNKSDSTDNTISLETAKKKALSNAKVDESKATFIKAKLDYDDGIKVYDIEFYTSDNEYEYEIDATTGTVRSKDIEAIKKKTTENKNTNTSSDNSSSYIGIDKAKKTALNHAGVSDATFKKAKLDRDDGKTVYDIEFYKDGIEYEYEIDALTGKILDYDRDSD